MKASPKVKSQKVFVFYVPSFNFKTLRLLTYLWQKIITKY